MKRLAVLLLVCAGSGAAQQQPVISQISIDSLDTSSFRVFFTVSQRAWVELRYGTKPGSYPYRTRSANCFDEQHNGCFSKGKMALSIAALKPDTTYYVLPTARPNPDNDIGICNTASCGAVEQVVKTLPGVQPAPPRSPAKWAPSPPDTSNYTVIPMQQSADGTCSAAATVTSRDKWTVNANDSIPAILSKAGYGTVIEFPQGVSCRFPASTLLPHLAPDPLACHGACAIADPGHRWIVFRTRQTHPADFPPFGSRITPDWSSKLAKFYCPAPKESQEFFNAEGGTEGVHHFWFQNMEWMDDPAYVPPVDDLDPVSFDYFARLGSQYQIKNNQFIVLDRIYAHGNGPPQRHYEGWEFGGNYQAMIGCYTAKVEAWRLAAWPSNRGKSTANLIDVPKNTFSMQARTPLLGMTGPATVRLTGGNGSGLVIGWLSKAGLEVRYTEGAGTISCTGCLATPTNKPADKPAGGGWQLFHGNIANGTFTGVEWNTEEWMTSRYLMAFGIQMSDLKSAGGPYYFANNYLDGVGEGFYIDPQYSGFANDDITYVMNHQIWPKNHFVRDPNWTGWRYNVRQHLESKRSHRVAIVGNVFSYSWSYQNDGPAILLSGRPTYNAQSLNDGLSDFTIRSNIISHGRTGIACGGMASTDNGGNEADGEVTRRVAITNNLLFDLGRWKYCDTVNCPSLGSFIFQNRPGCQDLVIKHNTAGPTYGEIPAWLYLGGGTVLSNILDFENNVLFLSKGPIGGGAVFGDWPPNLPNHEVLPAAHYDNAGDSPNVIQSLKQTFVNTVDTVVPNYIWKNNLVIGGWTAQDPSHIEDLTEWGIRRYAANLPDSDTYLAGKTMAARIAAARLGTNWQITPANPGTSPFGVNFAQLQSEQGRVTGISAPKTEPTIAKFFYKAPDERACSIDVSADGKDWTRTVDTAAQPGQNSGREITVGGLKPATQYQYRILCYYEQVNDGVLYTDYAPDEITNGTFKTPDAAAAPPPK